MTAQIPNCPQPETPWKPLIQNQQVQICRWGPRANPSATVDRDGCGDYWVRTSTGHVRQFDTLLQAFNYGDMQ